MRYIKNVSMTELKCPCKYISNCIFYANVLLIEENNQNRTD